MRQGAVKSPRIPPTPSHPVVCASHRPQMSHSPSVKHDSSLPFWPVDLRRLDVQDPVEGHCSSNGGVSIGQLGSMIPESTAGCCWVFFILLAAVFNVSITAAWPDRAIHYTDQRRRFLQEAAGRKITPSSSKKTSRLARNLLSLRGRFLSNRASPESGEGLSQASAKPFFWRAEADVDRSFLQGSGEEG